MRSSVVCALALIGVFAGSVLAYGAAAGTTLDVNLRDVTVKQAIDTLFDGQGLKYYVQPGVKGKIAELRLKGITLDEGLQALGDAAGFSFRIEDGAYVISPGRASAKAALSAAAGPAAPANAPGPSPAYQPAPPPPVVVNNNFTSPPPVVYSEPGGGGYAPAFNGGGYQGGWWGPFTVGAGPNVFGRFPQPPPPRGWVSSDQERLLRFEYSVPHRPGYIAPYPYYYP